MVQSKKFQDLDLNNAFLFATAIDVASLKSGEDFNDLKPSIIVFICTFDPFGKNAYRYTFEQRCTEYDFALGDETKRIFLNTKGKNDNEVSQELKWFLKYVENSTDGYVDQVEALRYVNFTKELKS